MPTPDNDPAGRFGGAWERQPADSRGVWLWVIYRADLHVLGAIRRAMHLHWSADGPKRKSAGCLIGFAPLGGPKLKRPIGTMRAKPPESGGQRIMSV